MTAIQNAATVYEKAFPNLNLTLNIEVGWGTFDNAVDPGLTGNDGAEGGDLNGDTVSYSTLKGWLAANINSPAAATMFANLPSYSQVSSNTQFYVPSGEEKALGVYTGSASAVDGAIGFGTSSAPWFWEEAAIHEIGHALGRETAFYDAGTPVAFDLTRYSSSGTLHWTGSGSPDYFSIDGGKTDLANYDTSSDYSDFTGLDQDPYNFQVNGVTSSLTALDMEVLNVLGFDAPLSSGQTLDILSGEGSRDVTLLSGATMVVLSGGTASGVIDSGGVDVVLGAASATTIDSGGVEVLVSGGTAAGTTVNSGGTEVVASGGTATGLVVSSGGIDVVVSGGTEIDTMILSGGVDVVAGGAALVLSGHTTTGTIVVSGGVDVVESGAAANRVVATTNGLLLVLSGGVASGAIIVSSGVDVVDGGATSGAIVNSGGVEVLVGGGVASGSIIGSGGLEVVGAGGAAQGLILGSGGVDVVVSGGAQSGTIVSSGGTDIIVNGSASGAVVGSGGFELVESGSVDSAVTISGGIFDVASGGATGSGAATFAGGGLLLLDASQSFTGLVAGFATADHLDLKDIAFGAGTSATFAPASGGASGTLTVTDGAHTAHITLLGQYTATQFATTSDGQGGTIVNETTAAAAAEPGLASVVTPRQT